MLSAFINSNTYKSVRISQISRNPMQPRKYFNMDSIIELANSIKEHGILNPLTVCKCKNGYELIAGERRLRAAKLAGFKEIPCIIISANRKESSIIAMVENLQRSDLDFFEEANAYKNIIETFSLTQDEVARKVGKTQAAIANKLRLLNLPDLICELIRKNNLSERHARALLKLPDDDLKYTAIEHIIKHNLNVTKSESYIEELLKEPENKKGTILRIIKDVRFFINTVDKAVNIMKESGVDATISKKEENDGGISINIIIPKAKI